MDEFWLAVQSVNREDAQLMLFVLQRNCNPGISYFAFLQTWAEIIQAVSLLPPLTVIGFSKAFSVGLVT